MDSVLNGEPMVSRGRIPRVFMRRTPPGEWSLRAERQGASYVLRAPLGAKMRATAYQREVLADAMANVDPAITIAKRAAATGKEILPSSLRRPREEMLRNTRSASYGEAACKLLVLGEMPLPELSPPVPLKLGEVATAAGRAVGLTYKEMAPHFQMNEGSVQRRFARFRESLEIPQRAAEVHILASAFATGALLIGEPYDPQQLGPGPAQSPRPNILLK